MTPFRLTLLHNNDGESKYVVGDSIANYGGVTRFKTVLDRLRAEADAYDTARGERQGHGADQLRRQLPRRPEPARLVPALRRRARPVLRLATRSSQLGYDAVTIGNHEFDFGPARLAQFIAGDAAGRAVPDARTPTSARADPAVAARTGRIADSTVVEQGRRADRHHRRLAAGDAHASPRRRNVKFHAEVAREVVNERGRSLTDGPGVDKIILSSHLQNIANEKTVVAQLKNVDIVISGGGDDLLANPGDRADPGRRHAGRPVSDWSRRTARARTCRSSRPRASTATSAA